MFDLPAYLARLRLSARPTRDAAGLQALHRAHRLAIPFENLDLGLGRPIAIDPAAAFAKLVGRPRGGYCFEHHRVFADALAALGFSARPLLARVLLGAAAPPPLTHVLSLVRMDGQDWIADPGFGDGYTPPMPLAEGEEATATDGARFALTREGADWTLWRDGDGDDPRPQYRFTLASVEDADLEQGNWWASTHPTSRFTRHRIASIVLPHGFARLTDRHYRRQVGVEISEGEIADPRVYRMRLSLLFGIDLTAEEVAQLF
ncbi:arylamine N-acetyltransferase family protein [Sphingomonas bacterium]|uniref:arylamine N-acetyltransferase family protein n=1 Tax=Sphingomonas bacterium TaxID=1895847 RepID=UPI001575EC83|nr:arylamine N-acetyltransferase [Sphingomonas bacterium]